MLGGNSLERSVDAARVSGIDRRQKSCTRERRSERSLWVGGTKPRGCFLEAWRRWRRGRILRGRIELCEEV